MARNVHCPSASLSYFVFLPCLAPAIMASASVPTVMVEDNSFEDDQIAAMTTDDIVRASRLLDNEIRVLKVG